MLAGAGARVLLLARTPAALESLVSEIQRRGGAARAYVVDLAQPAEVEAVCRHILNEYPYLDGVISNAGQSIRRSVYKAREREDLTRSLAVNFDGPARLLLGLLPDFRSGTVLVNVSTVSAKAPFAPRWGSYQGSKLGFDAWFNCLGAELHLRHIRICSVYLPLTRTRMSAPTYGRPWLALSAKEAAQAVAYAFVVPGRRLAPWWLGWQEALALLFPGPLSRSLSLLEKWESRRSKSL